MLKIIEVPSKSLKVCREIQILARDRAAILECRANFFCLCKMGLKCPKTGTIANISDIENQIKRYQRYKKKKIRRAVGKSVLLQKERYFPYKTLLGYQTY